MFFPEVTFAVTQFNSTSRSLALHGRKVKNLKNKQRQSFCPDANLEQTLLKVDLLVMKGIKRKWTLKNY